MDAVKMLVFIQMLSFAFKDSLPVICSIGSSLSPSTRSAIGVLDVSYFVLIIIFNGGTTLPTFPLMRSLSDIKTGILVPNATTINTKRLSACFKV